MSVFFLLSRSSLYFPYSLIHTAVRNTPIIRFLTRLSEMHFCCLVITAQCVVASTSINNCMLCCFVISFVIVLCPYSSSLISLASPAFSAFSSFSFSIPPLLIIPILLLLSPFPLSFSLHLTCGVLWKLILHLSTLG